jgi:hypothetical protein
MTERLLWSNNPEIWKIIRQRLRVKYSITKKVKRKIGKKYGIPLNVLENILIKTFKDSFNLTVKSIECEFLETMENGYILKGILSNLNSSNNTEKGVNIYFGNLLIFALDYDEKLKGESKILEKKVDYTYHLYNLDSIKDYFIEMEVFAKKELKNNIFQCLQDNLKGQKITPDEIIQFFKVK